MANSPILQASPDSANSTDLRQATFQEIDSLVDLVLETYDAIYTAAYKYMRSAADAAESETFQNEIYLHVPELRPLLFLMPDEQLDFRTGMAELVHAAEEHLNLKVSIKHAIETGTVDHIAPVAYRAYLRELPYDEYLQTPHWQEVRQGARLRAQYRCQVCNSSDGQLHVHHRTYENRGDERPEDVILLCATCHDLFHKNGRLSK